MATESPNTLLSNTRIKIVDILSEGTIQGFTPVSGVSGSNPLCSVVFDDIPVMNGDGSVNYNTSGQGFVFSFTSGTSGQQPMVGFEKVEALVPLPINTRVYNPPAGQGQSKTVVTAFNTSQYPDAEGVKVTMRVPAMYTVNTENGDTNAFSVFYEIDISTNGGPWVAQILGPDGNGDPSTVEEILGKCTSPYYRTHVIPLPKPTPGADYYEWKLRVRRISENILSNNTQNDLYVDSVAVISSNTYRYPMTAVVGLEISAEQFSAIPTRAYDIKGVRVLVPEGYTPTQYNTDGTITAASYPGIWTGVWGERKWTDNPAFIFYDLCTNKRYGLGNYIRREWVDKWTIYQIAQYCDEMVDDGNGGLEPRFTCNVALSTPQDAYTLLNNLVSVFRGMLYWANGSIFPVGSETRDPVYNFSNANVVGGVFSYADTPRTTRSTICIIRWNDPDNLFRPTPERIEDPDARAKYGAIVKEISAFATTSRGQAIRAANWILTAEQQLTDTVQFQTDIEGLYLRPGDIVNVYDNLRNNQQQGGRVVDFNSARSTLTLDKDITLKPSFTYYMAALVPATNVANASGITGSNQFGLIRNSQIETRRVTTAASTGINILTVDSGFSAALFRGSVFVLSASGSNTTIFDQATQYRVLSTSEPEPGRVGVLAVEYQTGINFLVNNNYSSVVSPPIVGSTTPPTAPTGIVGQRVTGLLVDNTFFSYAYVYWSGLDVVNTAYYDVSGKLGSNPWFSIGRPTTTGIQFVPNNPGTYSLAVAAFNANGFGSAYNTGTYTEPATNPFGTTAPLSGIIIAENFDPYSYSSALQRYTGYVGTQPVFLWDIALDQQDDSLETPSAQYVTGYRVKLKSVVDGTTDLLANPIIIEGKENNTLSWDPAFLYTGATIKPLRSFILDVETMDAFGQIASGARLAVNNIQPFPPVASGFVGFNGGVSYNITPARTADISGVYLWTNQSPSFTPTFNNATLLSTNLAGFVSGPQVGDVYTWFALTDTYGPSGSISANGDYNTRIYGPISGNANQIFGAFDLSIQEEIDDAINQISGAYNLLTGSITQFVSELSGQNQVTLLMVEGLSGQVVGTVPGEANTALNVRVNTAVVTSSGALSTQIDAVSARLQTTGSTLNAQVGTVSTALTNTGVALGSQINVVQANVDSTSGALNIRIGATGATLLTAQATADGALAQWITNLGVQTTGASAAVRIGAEAMVTGAVNGLGGAAIARWGFELDANGKVVSMQATSASFTGNGGYGTIVFGNANLQSNTFTPGSAGWQIKANGDAEFNNAAVRGAFTGGNPSSDYVTMDSRGLASRTNLSNDRLVISTATIGQKSVQVYNSSNNITAFLGTQTTIGEAFGALSLANTAGTSTVILNGLGGSATFTGNASVGGTMTVDGLLTINGNALIDGSDKLYFFNTSNGTYIDENFGLRLHGDGTHPVQVIGADLNVDSTVNAAAFNTTSSIRFKKNIQPLSGALEIVDQINAVRFDWKDKAISNDIGFIAEEINPIFPTIVGKNSDGEIMGLEYGRLTAVSIEAIKELKRRIEKLEKESNYAV